MQNANRPDAQVGDDVFQALVVQRRRRRPAPPRSTTPPAAPPSRSPSPEPIDAIPGVEQQRSTFNQIIGVTVVIALVVVALFFALLTVERTALYGVLKAIGARSSTLFGGVVVAGRRGHARSPPAIAGSVVVAARRDHPARLDPVRHLDRPHRHSVVLLLVAAVVGCAFSLRRVLRIDPASAIGAPTT